MTIIKRSALVAHSAHQLFELVDNIESYPLFLPWCGTSHVVSRSAEMVEATLTISWKGLHKSFTTRNQRHPHSHIDMSLVNGPFSQLEGRWEFKELGPHACKVSLDLTFDFAGGWMDALFKPIFNQIANSLVDAFCQRAAEVYGHV